MATFSYKPGGYAAVGSTSAYVNTGANVTLNGVVDTGQTLTITVVAGQWEVVNAGVNGGVATVIRDSGGTALSTATTGLGFAWSHVPVVIATGGDLGDYMGSGDGNDSLMGEGGADTLSGGAGIDTLLGGDGADTIHTGTGDDSAVGGAGNDTLRGDLGNDTLDGGVGNDFIYGNAGDDSVIGGDGQDTLVGYEDNDTLLGDAGDDMLIGNAGNDYIAGAADNDLVYGNAGDDSIVGGDGNDTLHGSEDNDTVFGNAGADTLYGNDGNDSLSGGDGADTLYGNLGNDVLAGGDGIDGFYWAATDTSGNDTITDLAVGDQIVLVGRDQVATFNGAAVVANAAITLYGTNTVTLQNLTGTYAWSATLTGGNTVMTLVADTPAPAAACYRRGTRILTDRGEQAIEEISITDKVVTHRGEIRPIRWIGRRSVKISALPLERRLRNRIVQIKADAIAPAMPHRDLFVSAGHLVLVEGHLVAALHLLNGKSIVLREDIDEIEYFHIECPDEEILVAEGLPAESFFDTGDKTMFDNALHLYQINYEHRIRRAFRHAPLVNGGLVLQQIRQRLAA